MSDDTKKRAVFLCAIGAKTFGLLEDLIAPASVEDRSYDDLVTVLKEHFEPESSAIVARFRFHTFVRGEAESESVFLARLRKLAKPCRFPPALLDEMLRDQLACGIRHERLQSRLLSESGLTLQSAVDLAMAQESAAASAAELSASLAAVNTGEAAAVRRVGEPESSQQARRRQSGVRDGGGGDQDGSSGRSRVSGSCSRCLQRHRQESCPFRMKQCFRCGRKGHIRVVCAKWSQQHLRQLGEDVIGPDGAAATLEENDSGEARLDEPNKGCPFSSLYSCF